MLIYGHRGARGEAPENTLASFASALQAGVTRVELDLHLSADHQLMVIHDPDPATYYRYSRPRRRPYRRTAGPHGCPPGSEGLGRTLPHSNP